MKVYYADPQQNGGLTTKIRHQNSMTMTKAVLPGETEFYIVPDTPTG